MPWVELPHAECEFPKYSDEENTRPMSGAIWKCASQGCNKLWMLVVDLESACWFEVVKTDALVHTGRTRGSFNHIEYLDNDPELRAQKEAKWKAHMTEQAELELAARVERSKIESVQWYERVPESSAHPTLPIWKRGLSFLARS